MKNLNQKLYNYLSEEELESAIAESVLSFANSKITLGEFCSEYLDTIKLTKSEAYYRSHKNSTKHLIKYFYESMYLSQISKNNSQKFMNQLIIQVPKGWPIYYRNIKAMFNVAVDREYLRKNPFTKLSLPKTQTEYPKYIDKERLEIIKGYISNNTIRDITTTAFYTGLRLAEVVNLKWDNVDFDRHLILVGDSEFSTKSYRPRVIPMTEKIQELFISRYDKELNKVYVFGKDKVAPYTKEYVSRKLKQAAIQSGSDPDIHFHTLRHSFASNLVQKGVEIYTVQKLLGHASVTTTEIYAHLNTDELKNAINKLNKDK